MSKNPFVKYARLFTGDSCTAQQFRALVLHLYNPYTSRTVALPVLLRCANAQHRQILIEILRWYAEHGEDDKPFMRLVKKLTSKKNGAHEKCRPGKSAPGSVQQMTLTY